MHICKNITINLTESDVKDIIIKHFLDKGYNISKSDINFNISNHLEGYGISEHPVTKFNGCDIKIKEEKTKTIITTNRTDVLFPPGY